LKKIALSLLLFIPFIAFAQSANNECSTAISISSGKSFCSSDGQYTTAGATSSFLGSGNDVWFAFTPLDGYDLFTTVYGAGNGGTLQSPTIRVFSNCISGAGTFNQVVGTPTTADNVTTLYTGGLKPGTTYYISVSGSNTGTFKLCLQNQTSPVKPGQDYATAKFLCSTESVRESNISGGGSNVNEGAGSCFDGYQETNSAWFKWVAGNDGTLVFTLTPTVVTDDLDWVLFDLGTGGTFTTRTVLACANGSGVTCSGSEYYYKTGLDFNSKDVGETVGCVAGQDGKVKFITMQVGHTYALMVNNAYAQGNGFTIDFKDQNGVAGTGIFSGPQAAIDFKENQPCTVGQSYTFSNLSTNFNSLSWDFGDGASIQTSASIAPVTVSYSTPGLKTVVLQALGANGCYTISTKVFTVGVKPETPAIAINKTQFCSQDNIILSTPALANTTYLWTGPNKFTANQATVTIPASGSSVSGTYTLIAMEGSCSSDPVSITVPAVLKTPVAAFRTLPNLPAKLSVPVSVEFINQSQFADSYLWNFGDGTTSTEVSPKHTYSTTGEFDVTLVAFNSGVCSGTVIKGTFVIKPDNTLFIPNTFTPNGDNINDELVVTITNLRAYHIRIFNRWGDTLFESVNIFENWNGLYKGQPLPVGTYYYVIDGFGLNGNNIKKSGYIALLR
jgi:gliding motility-associated-like protein